MKDVRELIGRGRVGQADLSCKAQFTEEVATQGDVLVLSVADRVLGQRNGS